jgi:mannosyltransferase
MTSLINSNKQIYLVVLSSALFAAWLYWSINGLSANYSFWFDELFSVGAAGESPEKRLQIYLADVHPPLYQEILACWFVLFSASELSGRLLSVLFVALSFLSFSVLRNRFGNVTLPH